MRYKQYIKELNYLIGDDRDKLFFFLLLIIFSSILDLLGIGLIAPYIGLIVNPELLSEGETFNFLFRYIENPSLNTILQIIGVALIIIFLIKSFLAIFINKLIFEFTFDHSIKLRTRLMESYQSLPYVQFIKRNSSEFIHNINLGAYFSQGILNPLLKLVSEGLVCLFILSFLAWENGPALILLVSLLALVIILYDVFFRKKVRDFGRLNNIYSNQILKGVNEGIGGIKEMRILGNERFFSEYVTHVAKQHAVINVKNQIISSLPRYFLEVVLVTFIVLIVMVSIYLGHDLKGILPLLSMFGVAGMRLAPSTSFIINGISQARFGRDAVKILYDDLTSLEESRKNIFENSSKSLKDFDFQELRLENVSFRYPGSNQDALKNVSLTIKAGESIGIIGPSGSGKTTLVDLLLGLLVQTNGKVFYNGKELCNELIPLQAQVAYLPQQVFILDSTLRENVAIGTKESDIDDSRVIEALEKASLGNVLRELPEGLDTRLGEYGVRLSGGQRQRVALARAFYYRRSVLVMDESTSALDNQTEEEIVNEIKGLKGQKTIIAIAHRVSTLRHCSVIYKMVSGEIATSGSYEEIVE